MGFLFDSLVHLFSSEPDARAAALARMLGRVLSHPPVSIADAPTRVWHYRKVSPRLYAVSVALGDDVGRMALSLADATGTTHPSAGLLHATMHAERGDLVALPEGCLGRSSHRYAIVTHAEGFLLEVADYERILGMDLELVIPVTTREARWIDANGVEAFAQRMREQEVSPYLDRIPGTTELPWAGDGP